MSDPHLREWARALVKRAGHRTARDVVLVMRQELARMAAEPHADLEELQRAAADVDEQWLRLPTKLCAHDWHAYPLEAVDVGLAHLDDLHAGAEQLDDGSIEHRLLCDWAARFDWSVEQ